MNNSSADNGNSSNDILGLSYEDGKVIFREGDMTNSLYIIQAGKVRLTKLLPSGRDVEVALLEPGEAFGIASLADEEIQPRYSSATAVGDTSVLEVERARLIKGIYEDPSLIFTVFRAMSNRARNLTDRLAACESRFENNKPDRE